MGTDLVRAVSEAGGQVKAVAVKVGVAAASNGVRVTADKQLAAATSVYRHQHLLCAACLQGGFDAFKR